MKRMLTGLFAGPLVVGLTAALASAAGKNATTPKITVDPNLLKPRVAPLPFPQGGTRTDMGRTLSIQPPNPPKPKTCPMDPSQVREVGKLIQGAQGGLGILFIAPLSAKMKDIDRQQEACRNAPAYKPGPAVWGATTNRK
jgi:hypothetical protein